MQEYNGATLTYEVFRDECLALNRPAIIRNAGFDLARLANLLQPCGLVSTFGSSHIVPVYAVHNTHAESVDDTSACVDTTETKDCMDCRDMPISEVFAKWCTHRTQACEPIYYLKDWHMQADLEAMNGQDTSSARAGCSWRRHGQLADGQCLYEVPAYLGDDWMDPFCALTTTLKTQMQPSFSPATSTSAVEGLGNGHSDYRFAYIGTTHTWTPLHYDVFGTYSWSLNVCGDKQWFFPDEAGNNLLIRSTVSGFENPPDIRVLCGVELIEVIQRPGDLVFVPSHYFHQVHNARGEALPLPGAAGCTLELTISINHNWCNEFCVEKMVTLFLGNVRYLRHLISLEDLEALFGCDCDAWHEHFEKMLLGGCNWNFKSMLCFLEFCRQRSGLLNHVKVVVQLAQLIERVSEADASLFSDKTK